MVHNKNVKIVDFCKITFRWLVSYSWRGVFIVRLLKVAVGGFLMCGLVANAFAVQYPSPSNGNDLIGRMQVIKAKYEDTFADLGDTYSLGYSQLVAANPGVDAWLPGTGTDILLPTRYILPDAPRTGVVINLPEYRLYYYPKDGKTVYTFPLGIGREGWSSPLGNTKIVGKVKDPTWTPPASIRAEHAKDGDILPAVVPAGPDNPLGPYKMQLGFSGYLIHGSNQKFGVGTRTSHGCFRMLNPDVTFLYSILPQGTNVNIVTQPYKIGIEDGKIYFEAHQALDEHPAPDLHKFLNDFLAKHGNNPNFIIDYSVVQLVAEHHDGIPVQIGNTEGIPVKQPVKEVETMQANDQVDTVEQAGTEISHEN